jgi:hypothetical protein
MWGVVGRCCHVLSSAFFGCGRGKSGRNREEGGEMEDDTVMTIFDDTVMTQIHH